MKSVISFPDRGHWGDSSWRGNTTGHVMRELIEQYSPKLVCDVCEGGGSSRDVCRDFGIDYVGLDLFNGNDYCRDFVLSQLPRPADLCFSHPAYHNMINYVSERAKHGKSLLDIEGDHSNCETIEEFLERSKVMLWNQRQAVKERGGIVASLIGDMRKNGMFYSFQSEFCKMLPRNELKAVVIKMQHNTVSGRKVYSKFKHPEINHEYLLIWEHSGSSIYQIAWDQAIEVKKEIASTWRSLIRLVMMELGQANLGEIYNQVEKVGTHLITGNSNWKSKIRQQLQKYHSHVERGVWAV